MTEEIIVAIDSLCRACLKPTSKKYTLTGKLISLEVTIADMIEFCTSKQPDLNEDLPDNICTFCYRNIRIAYEFFRQFYNSQDQLSSCKEVQEVDQKETFPDYDFLSIHSYAEPSAGTEDVEHDSNEQVFIESNQNSVDTFNPDSTEELKTVTKEAKVDLLELLDVDIDNSNFYDQNNEEIDSNVNTSDVEPTVIITNRENRDETLYPYICPLCEDIKFSRVDPFHKHVLEHNVDTVICVRCNAKPEYDVEEYIKHYKEFHKLQCEICQKTLASPFGYRYHMKQHIDTSCYKCPIKECNRSFVLRSLLRKHIKNHYEPAVFPCHLCPSQFNTRDSLRYHLKKHFNKKDHLCTVCGRSFYLAGHLTHHMYSHTGYKRYGCNFCEKKFTTSTCLRKHTVHCSKKHGIE